MASTEQKPETKPLTKPVEPQNRIKDDEIVCQICTPEDADKIAEGLYGSFSSEAWDIIEPPATRSGSLATRQKRLATRLIPTFSIPHLTWVKAVHVPTSQIMGVAAWVGPGGAIHSLFRRSAVDFFGWKESMGWTDADLEELWRGINLEAWETPHTTGDRLREEYFKGEPHWYLDTLFTWPEWQGKGVASKLLNWAFEKADATDPVTPLYLESSAMGRAVYLRWGFVPLGVKNLVRRGPAVTK